MRVKGTRSWDFYGWCRGDDEEGDLCAEDDTYILDWRWDFAGASNVLPYATHRFESDGTKSVTLTVTDEHGETDSATCSLTAEAPVGTRVTCE